MTGYQQAILYLSGAYTGDRFCVRNVDRHFVDAVYINYPELIASKGLNGLAASEPDKPWYADAQAWAVDRGITDGTEPDGPVTRAQAWTMLYRASK